MKCHEVIDRFDELLEDRLGNSERRAVRAHLEECSDCADEFEFLCELRGRVSRLPNTLEPPRDLWPGIASSIEGHTVVTGHFGRRMLLAAAAAVLIAGSMTVAFLAGRSSTTPTAELEEATDSSASTYLLASFEELGVEDYEATRAELLDALEARRGDLSPETVEVVMLNLRLIDDAMAEIAEALGSDPESEFLMKQLARAYRRQIGLLQQAIRLPAEV
jgi:hypothetical protein